MPAADRDQTTADVQATCCATLVDQWVRDGVSLAMVAPGSRSTPMALAMAAAADLRVAPASPGKAERLLPFLTHARATLYLNLEEAGILAQTRFPNSGQAARALVDRGAARVLVTDGARDASDARLDAPTLTVAAHPVQARRVTGAGDTFMAAHLFAETRGATRPEALTRAQAAAAAYVAQDEGTP